MTPLADFRLRLENNEYTRLPLWMIGPRSYFADRAAPIVEVIAIPARAFGKESLRLEARRERRVTRNYFRRREKILHPYRTSLQEEGSSDRYHVDLRVFGLGNWSHFLNKAIPISVLIRDHLSKLNQPEPIFILNDAALSAATQLLEYLGLEYICTNRMVRAPLIRVDFSNISIIDEMSRDLVSSISYDIDRFIKSVPITRGEKVFLNRRPPNRSIINNGEISRILRAAGYDEFFMEDHSAAEQIAIVLRASKIVAIHGAALAPLLFRNKKHGLLQLFEIAPPGHVSPFFRNMITDLPCTYRMIRGVPDSAMASDAFSDVERPSMQFTRKHSLRQFRLDPASLEFAFNSADDENFPMGTIAQPV